MFIVTSFTIAKTWKQAKCSIHQHTNQESVTHTDTPEYYSTVKKKKTLPFTTTWMDLQGIMLSEISQTEKDKYCIFLLVCGF